MPPPFLLLLLLLLPLFSASPSSPITTTDSNSNSKLPVFREAPAFRNSRRCSEKRNPSATIHIAMTLDLAYLRGSMAAVFSLLRHSACPENLTFHFLASHRTQYLLLTILTTFPSLSFHLHFFDPSSVSPHISPSSLRPSLDHPLNYARIYLPDLLPPSLPRVLYLDSDLLLVDDVSLLWRTPLRRHVLAAPEYCHANFTPYFTPLFWRHFSKVFHGRRRRPCYFNTGVMVIDLGRWREGGYGVRLERWMRIQKRYGIYELGSLPPFLLVFGGEVERVEHRWNQHGLGGDNVEGGCRDLHPGNVSLLHWSGKGKPWLRLDSGRPCPLDRLWAPYDLLRPDPASSSSSSSSSFLYDS